MTNQDIDEKAMKHLARKRWIVVLIAAYTAFCAHSIKQIIEGEYSQPEDYDLYLP